MDLFQQGSEDYFNNLQVVIKLQLLERLESMGPHLFFQAT